MPVARPALLALPLAVAAALAPAPARASAPEGAPFEMEPLQLVLLVRPASRPELADAEAKALQARHLEYLGKMAESGKMVVAGPFERQSDETLRGACIYRVATLEEARALAEGDPAVRAGRLRVEVMTWWVGKGYVAFPKAPPVAAAPAAR